jgi:hypothetical protein
MWYQAYNKLTPEREGISLLDFKAGEAINSAVGAEIMRDMAKVMFEPLTTAAIKRMMRLKDEAKAKMMETMQAEYNNPALFKEIMDEFMMIWRQADANNDGNLD